MRKNLITVAALLVCLGVCAQAFGQGGAGTLGTLTGIVTDSSKARLPGVRVRVLNEDTGVGNSMLTNDSGDFSFLLSPGTKYMISAEFTGFQKREITKITVRAADTVRLDLSLEIGSIDVVQRVEASRDPLLNGATQDIGNLLDEVQIQGLPLVGNDPLALITTLPGYRANPLGHEFDTVGGLPMTMMNTVRDGLSVTDPLFPNGVSSGTMLNPEMISEIRLILSPVDAEAGRGNGQVQITTRSGTNKFQWNINYNLRQNALNALGPSTSRTKQPFSATFQYLISVGGPIIKNRTFYFVNWDHQLRFARSGAGTGSNGFGGYLSVPVLTDPARNGIFRYFDGYSTLTCGGGSTVTTGTAASWPVDCGDTTIVPQVWPVNLQLYDGALKCYSVFGTIKFDGTPFDPATDCGTYIPRRDDGRGLGVASWVPDPGNTKNGVGIVPGGMDYYARQAAGMNPVFSWEAMATMPDGSQVQVQRPPDRTGYIQRLLGFMPHATSNFSVFSTGGQLSGGGPVGTLNDGLNKGAYDYVRGSEGLDNTNTFRGGTFGIGTSLDQANVGHKVINLKVDHVIDSRSRVTVSTSFQDDQNSRLQFQSRWPDGINGYSARVPRVLTVNGITTLSPTMVNEARFGINLNRSTQLPPWGNPDPGEAKRARSFLQQGWIDPNCGGANASDACKTYGDTTPIYFTPGTGLFDYRDNVLPSSANAGFGTGFGFGVSAPAECGGTANFTGAFGISGSYNCEAYGKLLNFADTFSWNYRSHSIRAGAEFRLTRTHEDSSSIIPNATGGASFQSGSPLASIDPAVMPDMPGFVAGSNGGRNQNVATWSTDLLYFLSGSVSQVQQTFWVNGVNNYMDGTWDTWSTNDGKRTRHTVQNEYAFFVKDDWKIGRRLTLNLGVRYENYGNLYMKGFATGIVDDGLGLFGPSRVQGEDPFTRWLVPGGTPGGPPAIFFSGYGPTPPAINVTGEFLPNGQPSYIPGYCNPAVVACPGNVSIGGTDVQSVPAVGAGFAGPWTPLYACVWNHRQANLSAEAQAAMWVPEYNNGFSSCDPSLLTTHIFVGPGSDHPDLPTLYRDKNNIGPAIGFSYRAPFVGNRTLLVRGGFQFTFGSAGRDRTVGTGSSAQASMQDGGKALGGNLDQTTTGCGNSVIALQCLEGYNASTAPSIYALTLADFPNLIPLQTSTQPPTLGGYGFGIAGNRTAFVQDFSANRSVTATAFARGYQDARTENYTFSVSTNLTRSSTIAVSYVGTLGKNRPTGININMPATYNNPELIDALTRTRAGEDVPLFDQMLGGLNLTAFTGTAAAANGFGAIGTCVTPTGANAALILAGKQAAYDAGVRDAGNCTRDQMYQSGSAHLRNANPANFGGFGSLSTNLANGNFSAVAAVIAAGNPGTRPLWNNNPWADVQNGRLLRNGCDRIASATTTTRNDLISGSATTGNTNLMRCFPENWLVANPALDTGVSGTAAFTQGTGAIYKANWGWTNYQQLQVQYTLRLPSGANLQATYLTSKTLALPRDFYRTNNFSNNAGGGSSFGVVTGFADPRTEESRRRDYAESSDSLKHAIRLNGVFQLPFGTGKLLLNNAPGFVDKILGGWQMGIIYNGQSGAPFSIQAGDMLYGISSGSSSGCNAYSGSLSAVGGGGTGCQSGLSFPDIVSPLWQTPNGKSRANGPGGNTTYYGYPSPFATVRDPQCTNSKIVNRSVMSEGNRPEPNCGLRAMVLKVDPSTPGAFYSSEVDNGLTPLLIMLQNPMPGKQGSLGAQTMRQPGRFYLDANLAKTFMFSESRGIQIRIDATNVLNHPQPPDLYMSLGPGGSVSDESTSQQSAISSGCFGGNAFCGRQVQVGVRMINN